MTPFELRHPRRKGEDLRKYITRVIATDCKSDIPGVPEDMIGEALSFYRERVAEHVQRQAEERAATERRHIEHRLSELTAAHAELQRRYSSLKGSLPTMISVREAEEERLKAFRRARNKASDLAETSDGCPTNLSEAIYAIPDPKPKWTK